MSCINRRIYCVTFLVIALFAVGSVDAIAQTSQLMPNRDALSGTSMVVWGNTTAPAGTVYKLEYGDLAEENGTVPAGGSSYLAFNHTYSTALPQEGFTATLTIGSSSATVDIKVTNDVAAGLTAEQKREIETNMAIEDGLRFLYQSVENLEATHVGGWATVQWPNNHGSVGSFGSMSLLAFENHGYLPTGNHIYAPLVQGGINYIFSLLTPITLQNGGSGEPAGSPCVGIGTPSGDLTCEGLYAPSAGSIGYSTAVVMLAITGSGVTQAWTATTGDATYVNGQTYASIVQRLSNAVVWGQSDGDDLDRGGWRYGLDNANSDGSAVGWNVLALLDATAYGATVPAHAKTELAYVIARTTAADGGMGYNSPTNIPNTAKAGVRLQALGYMGVGLGDNPPVGGPTPQITVDYLNTYWNTNTESAANTYDCDNGALPGTLNKGCIYAMFNVFKGLKLSGVQTLSNVPRADNDWNKDYRDFLVLNQINPNTLSGGSWDSPTISFSAHIDSQATGTTALGLIILSPTALILPTSLTLGPLTDTNLFGEDHTVTATALSSGGLPVAGVTVTFEVLSGPSSPLSGTALTNSSGEAIFTYTNNGPDEGTDVIRARIGNTVLSNTVEKTWESPNDPPVPNAGADRPEATAAGLCLATVSLNGSATDSDVGDTLTFTWTGADGTIADPNAAQTTVSGLGLGAHTFTLTVNDGTVSVSDDVVITIEDQEPPTISINPLSPNGNAGWFKFPTLTGVLVQATAADNCSVDVTVETSGAQVAAEAPGSSVTVNTDGITTVDFEAIDGAGNMAGASTIVKLDRALPIITLTSTPPPNGAGWNNTDVTLSFSCTDPIPSSGGPSCPADLVFTDEGEFPGVVTSTDVAGNVGSLPYLVKIDKTAPEMKNVFNPETLTVDVLALDDGSGVTSDPIVPVCVPTSWGSGKASAKNSGKGPNAELCTYTVTDAAGNTTVLVEKRKKTGSNASKKNSSKGGGGGEVEIEVVSIQYNDGDVIAFPPKADKKFEWSLNSDGTLKELEQKMELGKGNTKQQVTAHYSSKKETTEINVHGGDGKLVGDGLTLLCMISSDGELDIVFDPTGLTPKNSVKSSLKVASEKSSDKVSEKSSGKSSDKGSDKGSKKNSSKGGKG